MANECGSDVLFTISASASGSRSRSTGFIATSRLQVSKCSSLSVAPAGLGYIATTQFVTVECMKNASPIGIRNCAHSSSGSAKSASQRVRLPVGRNSASPDRSAQQLSHTHTI